jgi:putative membrane protein
MMLEALLAYAHFVAILALVVFLTSEAALCRTEWLNAAVVRRLGSVDLWYLGSAIAVLATGMARTIWGMKGWEWYWSQPWLHVKLGLFIVIALMSIVPTRAFIRWRRSVAGGSALPAADEVRSVRRWVMVEAHLLVLIPLAAVLLARGIGTR